MNTTTEKKSFIDIIKKRKAFILPLILVVTLLGIVVFYQFKISKIETEFTVEKTEYKANFDKQMFQLKLDNAYDLSVVFSWSVRSEIMRGNNEQVSLLFNQFVKTPIVTSVTFINTDNVVAISTNKKNEGIVLADKSKTINPVKAVVDNELVLPVMGINENLGFLHIVFEKLDSKVDGTYTKIDIEE